MPGLHHRTTPDDSGTKLKKAEYESVLSHELDSGVADDFVRHDGTNLVRFGKGTNTQFLRGDISWQGIDDTPVNGETGAPISSNWAHDHNAAKTGVHAAGANNLATDADITTHAALATVHQDAPALIATHTAIASAHHTAYSAPTRSRSIQPFHYTGATPSDGGFAMNAAAEVIYFNFAVPSDFSSLTSVEVVVREGGTGTVDWTFATNFGADGEAYNNHTDSATADGFDTSSAGTIDTIDVSAAFTGLAAGDHVDASFVLNVVTSSGWFYFKELLFKYAE